MKRSVAFLLVLLAGCAGKTIPQSSPMRASLPEMPSTTAKGKEPIRTGITEDERERQLRGLIAELKVKEEAEAAAKKRQAEEPTQQTKQEEKPETKQEKKSESTDKAPSLELYEFLYPTTKNGPKGVSRPDLIGKKIRTGVAVSIFHDQAPGKDNPDRLKVICGSGDEKAIYMLLVEFLDSQKKGVQALKGHDIILVRGVLNQKGDVVVLEQAELLKAVRP